MSTVTKAQRITQLMNSRRGKKASITKRVSHINRIVQEGGSRSQVTFLIEALEKVRAALQAVCDELVSLDPDTDSEWMDEESLRIDTCISEAKGYLERRRDDPPSTESLCESWINKNQYKPNADSDYATSSRQDECVDDVTDEFAAMRTNTLNEKGSTATSSTILKPPHLMWQPNANSVFMPNDQQFVSYNDNNINGSSNMNVSSGVFVPGNAYSNQSGVHNSIAPLMNSIPLNTRTTNINSNMNQSHVHQYQPSRPVPSH